MPSLAAAVASFCSGWSRAYGPMPAVAVAIAAPFLCSGWSRAYGSMPPSPLAQSSHSLSSSPPLPSSSPPFHRPLLFFRRCLRSFAIAHSFVCAFLSFLSFVDSSASFLLSVRRASVSIPLAYRNSFLSFFAVLIPSFLTSPSSSSPSPSPPTCLPPPSATKACRVMCLPSIPYRFRSCAFLFFRLLLLFRSFSLLVPLPLVPPSFLPLFRLLRSVVASRVRDCLQQSLRGPLVSFHGPLGGG
ncbi:hypothetical protein BX666DRAFT_1503666 [Dichotomocladium elegans]|nr:hypothetical protein BX666DRAFT_1503666 [Dichotomocladium elegans]